MGIQNLSAYDLQYAREKKLKIKLVPVAKELDEQNVTLFVMPKVCKRIEFLYNVDYEYNCVTVQAAFADQQFFMVKGPAATLPARPYCRTLQPYDMITSTSTKKPIKRKI
jgi:homoserine dehydrogenase